MATKSNEVMVTVGWSVSVKIPVDPSRLKQKDYLDELRDLAVREAAVMGRYYELSDNFGIKTIVQINEDHPLYGILDDHHLVLIPYRQLKT